MSSDFVFVGRNGSITSGFAGRRRKTRQQCIANRQLLLGGGVATIHGFGSVSNRLCTKDPRENGSGPRADAKKRKRKEEDEQEQGRTNQQLGPPAQGGSLEGAPASGLELDLHLVLGCTW